MIRHFVTDRLRFGLTIDALVAAAARASRSGAAIVQVRERDLSDVALAALVRRIVEAVAPATRVLVNDRADVAVAAAAHGVHLRGDSVPASRLRATVVPPGFTIGRSVHTLDEIDAAVTGGGCDYLMFGTVFASAGKPAGHPVAGVERLADACRRSPLPVIAIGGMTPEREPAVRQAGAAGLAAVGWFM